jgi:hypothetical protein
VATVFDRITGLRRIDRMENTAGDLFTNSLSSSCDPVKKMLSVKT